jgi:lipid A ethanolaminephosphotransferase
VLVSLVKLATEREERGPRLRIAGDARQLPRATGARPRLLVIVVGETARAANWGLDGYVRQTTPELARTPGVVNFPDVTACGSSTEVSLPCMFSVYGRESYDKAAIRGHESLLHLLSRVGIQVLWRDNQSGCKGVCDGLPTQRPDAARDPDYCNALRCLDGILLSPDSALSGDGRHDQVVVLHMLGNHGPNYNDRIPGRFRHYLPVCESADLGDCSRSQIVNAYDNALLYTDHLLASAIAQLQRQADYDTALLYVSDHGESLGENGLYLHGMPYAIAPAEQLKVPMLAWLSPGFATATGIDGACLARHALQPITHDSLFHSVLGAMDVATAAYRADRDVFAACRPARATPAAAAALPGTRT